MKIRIISIIALLTICNPATATFYFNKAGDLLSACESENTDCMAYISGILDSYYLFKSMNTNSANLICIPSPGVTQGQLVEDFKRTAKSNSDKLHYQAELMVFRTLTTTYPCK